MQLDPASPSPNSSPSVTGVVPADNAGGVAIGAAVKADLDLPNGGLDPRSVTEGSVRLVEAATGTAVPAQVRVTDDAERLTLAPTAELDYATTYRFEITAAVVDAGGAAFAAFSSTFTTVPGEVPSVIRARPADGARDVPTDTAVATDLNGNVDKRTLRAAGVVYLTNLSTGARVPGRPGSTGAGDSISFQPNEVLEPGTDYAFTVTAGVIDTDGRAFAPFTSTFTTGGSRGGCGEDCAVAVVPQPTAAGERHSSLAFGPDGNLYAATIVGEIKRYPVGPDGTLGAPTTLTSLIDASGGPRLTVGLTFDPDATADDLVVRVTHTEIGDFDDGAVRPGINAPWTGKLTRLSGPDLETAQDVVIGLPRSNKDHVTNSVAFNPAEPGVVYFVQGSNTAMGAPDRAWGYQEERALSGAVLRLDLTAIGSLPLDVQTEDGGTYEPFAPGAPLMVYASGTRNAYDLVCTRTATSMYPPTARTRGGVVPRYNPIPGTCDNRIDSRPYSGPTLERPSDVNGNYTTGDSEGETDGWTVGETRQDYLFRVEAGGYYGTPNPKRCEWILFGGGGSPLNDRVPEYPGSVKPDPNYRGFAYDFGKNVSPNGALEYRGDAFPELRGKLLVVRYNNGSDVVAVSFGSSGDVAGEAVAIVPGDFGNPIDLAEDPSTGLLYVSSYDELGVSPGGRGSRCYGLNKQLTWKGRRSAQELGRSRLEVRGKERARWRRRRS
jgi:glucose/arabinose dehydrogenase